MQKNHVTFGIGYRCFSSLGRPPPGYRSVISPAGLFLTCVSSERHRFSRNGKSRGEKGIEFTWLNPPRNYCDATIGFSWDQDTPKGDYWPLLGRDVHGCGACRRTSGHHARGEGGRGGIWALPLGYHWDVGI